MSSRRRGRPLSFVCQLVVVVRSSEFVVIHHPTCSDGGLSRGTGRFRLRRFLFTVRNLFPRRSSPLTFLFSHLRLRVRLRVSRHLPKVGFLSQRYLRRLDDETLSRPAIRPIDASIHAERRLMSLDAAYITSVDARALRPAEFVVLLHATVSPPGGVFPTIDRVARACALDDAIRTSRSPPRAPQVHDRPRASTSVATGAPSLEFSPRLGLLTGRSFFNPVEVGVEVESGRDGVARPLSAARRCVRNGERT